MADKKATQDKKAPEKKADDSKVVIASEPNAEVERLTKALEDSGVEVVQLNGLLEKANVATSNLQTQLSDAEDVITILQGRIDDLEAEPEDEVIASEEVETNKDGFVPGQAVSFEQVLKAQRKNVKK